MNLKKETSMNSEINNFNLEKYDFETLLNSINKCYADDFKDNLPKVSDFPKKIFNSTDNINLKCLIEFSETVDNIYTKSVAKRIAGVRHIQFARDNNVKLDLLPTWNLISASILDLPSECIVSSIGSQGFLSIPLFKYDENMEEFDFIRFHIWHNDLLDYINQEISERFSIHSHSFLAQSWIINGIIINERYSVEKTNDDSESSLFKIEYNKTLNKVNQHTSSAVNTGQNVNVNKLAKEVYKTNETYKINAGEYHKSYSEGKNGLSSTFFSFTTQNKTVVQSNVTGPSKMQTSEINRKMHIDPKQLILEINQKFN